MTNPTTLTEQVEQAIVNRRLFPQGEPILVAVSGGLDSMVLLHLLLQLGKSHGWRLTVAHFNHQLRGRSSDADEWLVERTAKKWGLPFVAERGDVRMFARENKLSLEMAGRKLRHEFLAREASKRKIRRIALAHHADDQVELFFLRLLRGAGGEGLAGMKWQSPSPADPKIFLMRPLLGEPKSVLAHYVKEARVPFREDATNAQWDLQRNRIRHELLPLLRTNYQPALNRVILRQMELVGDESEYVASAARKWLEGQRLTDFDELPVALQRRCLQLQLLQKGLPIGFDLIEALRVFANRPVIVPKGGLVFKKQPVTGNKGFNSHAIAVQRDTFGNLLISESIKPSFDSNCLKVRLQGRKGEIGFDVAQIKWQIMPVANGTLRAVPGRENCELFDAAKVGSDIVLRHWQPGDRFQPIGMAKTAKLQDLFMNQKIPREQRHELLVGATAGGEVFWVEGLRMGERFKLDKDTRYGLKWRWKRLS